MGCKVGYYVPVNSKCPTGSIRRIEMKMRITTDNSGRVTISYDSQFGERIQRTFSTAGIDGGYVIELTDSGSQQVCDRLTSRGDTLRCSSRANLPALIRQEYRAMRRAVVAA